jgi:hypothetical protein
MEMPQEPRLYFYLHQIHLESNSIQKRFALPRKTTLSCHPKIPGKHGYHYIYIHHFTCLQMELAHQDLSVRDLTISLICYPKYPYSHLTHSNELSWALTLVFAEVSMKTAP